MITFIIKTFKRKEACEKLVKSIRKYYNYPILIANDDDEKLEIDGAKVYHLDFDVGLSAGRNFLIKKVETKYFVLLDDDFVFTKETDINKFLELVENTDFDLIGGSLREDGKIRNYEGTYEFKNRILKYDKEPISTDEIIPQYDFVFNFFIARTDIFDEIGWDEKLKLAEHTAFFFDHKGQMKIGYCEDVIVTHEPIRLPNYSEWRARGKQFMNDFCVARNIRELHGLENNIYKAKFEIRKSRTDDVDFLITTFKRKEYLERLLFSIAEFYPQAKIFIADQNERFDVKYYKDLWNRLFDAGIVHKPSALAIGFDAGISKSRNRLIEETSGKYKLILEDDFIFREETDIENMMDLLEMDEKIGIVGGAMKQNNKIVHFEFKLEIIDGVLYQRDDGNDIKEFKGIEYKETDCVLNFALMRNEMFDKKIKWDNDLKTTEHTDFFLRIKKSPWKVIYTHDVIIGHDHKENSPEYQKMRDRREFLVLMMYKHKLKKLQYLNGHVYELDGANIKQYKIS